MNAIDLLRMDHQRLFKLARQFQEAGTSREVFAERLNDFTQALKLHKKMEEEKFYPELKVFDAVRLRVEQSYYDHRAVDELLDKLWDLPKEARDQESAALVTRLALAVEQHISHDEQYLLPQAERLLGPSRLQELFYDMDEVRTHQSDRDSMIYPASRLGPAK